jgi:hypothetical protein
MMSEQTARSTSESAAASGKSAPAGGDEAVEAERQQVHLRPDEREGGAVGADGDRGDEAEGGKRRRRHLRRQHVEESLRAARAHAFGSLELPLVEVDEDGEQHEHDARHEVVGIGEDEAGRAVEEARDSGRIGAELGEEQRHEAGASQHKNEAVGDNEAREGERQRDRHLQQRAPRRRQVSEMQRHGDSDGERDGACAEAERERAEQRIEKFGAREEAE